MAYSLLNFLKKIAKYGEMVLLKTCTLFLKCSHWCLQIRALENRGCVISKVNVALAWFASKEKQTPEFSVCQINFFNFFFCRLRNWKSMVGRFIVSISIFLLSRMWRKSFRNSRIRETCRFKTSKSKMLFLHLPLLDLFFHAIF